MVTSPVGLEGTIIILIIGIILWGASRAVPAPWSSALFWIGIVMIIIGAILLAIAVIPMFTGGALVAPLIFIS